MASVIVGQIGFSSWAMLAWAAAAGIPIAIHLLRRKRRHVVPWATMRLLQQVIEQQSKRARLEQWLLLLLRVAILLILALALARPFLAGSFNPADTLVTAPNKTWIIVIDTSYSMSHRAPRGSRIERAKQQALRTINESSSGDAFSLIAAGNPPRAIIGSATFDRASLAHEIDRVSTNAGGSSIPAALALVDELISDIHRNANLPQTIEVLILSDLGKDAWPMTGETNLQNQLAQTSKSASVSIVNLADDQPTNIAITNMTATTLRPLAGQLLDVDVTVASYGAAVKSLPIQLELNGQVVNSQEVDIAADQIQILRMSVNIPNVEYAVLTATVPQDDLPIDNRFDLALKPTIGTRVLIVQPTSQSTSAWQLALQSASPSASAVLNRQNMQTVSELAWPSQTLGDWDMILFDDVPLADSAQIERVRRFVEAGGSVTFACGKRQSPIASDSVREQLQQLQGLTLSAISDEGDWSIDPLEYRSALVKPFLGFPNAGLLTTPIFRYWKVRQTTPDLMIDLGLTTGDPLIARHAVGRGMVASILSAPEDGQSRAGQSSWNALTTWPSFLPIAQQLAQVLTSSSSEHRNLIVGQTIADQLAAFAAAKRVKLQLPDETVVSLSCSPVDDNGISTWSFHHTDQRGVYKLIEPSDQPGVFALNIDPIQSSLQAIDTGPLQPYMTGNQPDRIDPQSAGDEPIHHSDVLSRILLTALAFLLICETLIAWSLGKRTA